MTLGNHNGTDGQTDGQTDRVRRNMRPPPREEGRIINEKKMIWSNRKLIIHRSPLVELPRRNCRTSASGSFSTCPIDSSVK